MAVQWLPTAEQVSASKGTGTEVTTTDSTTTNTTLGEKIITQNLGEKLITETEEAFNQTNTNTAVLTEDAGGIVKFSVPVFGGIGLAAPSPTCPA